MTVRVEKREEVVVEVVIFGKEQCGKVEIGKAGKVAVEVAVYEVVVFGKAGEFGTEMLEIEKFKMGKVGKVVRKQRGRRVGKRREVWGMERVVGFEARSFAAW